MLLDITGKNWHYVKCCRPLAEKPQKIEWGSYIAHFTQWIPINLASGKQINKNCKHQLEVLKFLNTTLLGTVLVHTRRTILSWVQLFDRPRRKQRDVFCFHLHSNHFLILFLALYLINCMGHSLINFIKSEI